MSTKPIAVQRARLNLLPVIVAILLGVTVAVAAHGRTWSTHAGQSGWSARALALVVIVGVALVALLLGLSIRRHQTGGLIWQVGGTALGAVLLTAIAVIAAALLYQHFTPPLCEPNCGYVRGESFGGGSAPAGVAVNHGPAAQGKLIAGKSTRSHRRPTSLFLVWLALGVLIAGTAIWIWRRRPDARALSIWRERRTRHQQQDVAPDASALTIDEADPSEAATRYIEASLDDLRREPDLRRAIIACYARMEQLVAHDGSPREQWETPFEYLDRIYAKTGKPLGRLTVLYEEAQFSPHPLDNQRRAEAIRALTAIRDELGSSSV